MSSCGSSPIRNLEVTTIASVTVTAHSCVFAREGQITFGLGGQTASEPLSPQGFSSLTVASSMVTVLPADDGK